MSNTRLMLPAILIGALLVGSCDSLSGPPDLGTVSGRVVLAQYLIPVQGVRVELWSPDNPLYDPSVMDVSTGADGAYTFEQVEQGSGWLIGVGLADADWHYEESALTVREHTIVPDFELTPYDGKEFTLYVEVRTGSGQNIAGADAAIGALHLITDGSGRCTFDGLHRGDWYRITVEAPGFQEYSVDYHAYILNCFFHPFCSLEPAGSIVVHMSPV